jgi:hypothetical protein
MPNKQHRYKEVLRDFERAGLTLAPSRYWLESPLNQFKVDFIYPDFSYFMGNKVLEILYNLNNSCTYYSSMIDTSIKTQYTVGSG